jgi:hypothetical protein
MVTGRLDGCLAGRMELCILNGSAQDEAEAKPVQSLASLLVAGRKKSLIFYVLQATCSEVMHAQNTRVGFIACSDQRYIILKLWTEIASETNTSRKSF